jgi:hypothetical protein
MLYTAALSFVHQTGRTVRFDNTKENHMKKSIVMIVLLVAALAVFTTGVAFAQTPQPPQPVNSAVRGTGLLYDYMVNAMAQALGITPADFEARRASGETAYQIALDLGFTADKIPALLSGARAQAIDAAAAAGVITQQQGAWMKTRGAQMGMGTGICDGTGQRLGQGQGMMGQGMGRGGGRWQQTNP